MYFDVLINFIFADVILDLSCSLIAQVSHPYDNVGNARVLCVVSQVCVWN